MKNMKIPVENNLDEIVGELERKGYVEHYRKPAKKQHNWVVVEKRGCYTGWYDVYVLCEKTYVLTTLAELRSMTIETLKEM